MILSTIKTYALAVLGAVAAFGLFMWQMTRANFKSAQLKGEKKARKVERKATESMIDGLDNENKAVKDAKNNTTRDGFS